MNRDVFTQVASNALEFVEFGIDNVDNNPKQSLISFYTAVELFLKARLLTEHWSLVVVKPESANLDKFNSGNFQSVGLGQACSRLKDIANDGIPDKTFTVFDDLRIHRNKIVHFTHEAFLNNSVALQAEQLRTWVHLHALLTERWKKQFLDQTDRIYAIQAKMLERGEYLSECFNQKEENILNIEANGKSIVYCEFCQKRSGIVLNRGHDGIQYNCQVCSTDRTSYEATTAKIVCPQCGTAVEFFHQSIAACSQCHLDFDASVLTTACISQYGIGDPDHHDSENKVNVFCDFCRHDAPTVFYIDGMWSCIACYSRGYGVTDCVDCDVEYFGNTNELQLAGCFLCAEKRDTYSHIYENTYNHMPDSEKIVFDRHSRELDAKIEYRQTL